MKIANYALTYWAEFRPYTSEDEARNMLKIQSCHYERTLNTSIVLRNGLIEFDRTALTNASPERIISSALK